MLRAIEIEGKSAEPFKSLQAAANTNIGINGITKIFADDKPLIKMTVQRGKKVYHLEQMILTARGADEQNHFQGFVEQSTLVRH